MHLEQQAQGVVHLLKQVRGAVYLLMQVRGVVHLLKQVEDRLSKVTSPSHESAPVPNYWCVRGEYAPWVWSCAWSANVSSEGVRA